MASAKTISLDPIACCSPVRTDVLDEAQAALLAASFAALADPIRLRLLSHIAAAGVNEVCACDLVEPSGRSQPTVSHHLKKLTDAGLLEREQRGKWAYFSIKDEAMARLAGLADLTKGTR